MTTTNQAIKTFNQRRATEAALKNEQLTRQRVDRLERAVSCEPGGGLHQLAVWQNTTWRIVMERGFFGRIKWLFFGR